LKMILLVGGAMPLFIITRVGILLANQDPAFAGRMDERPL